MKKKLVPYIMELTLRIIAAQGCDHFTSGNCWDNWRKPLAKDGADEVCNPCLAQAALDALDN